MSRLSFVLEINARSYDFFLPLSKIYTSPCCATFHYGNNLPSLIANVEIPLPDADQYFDEYYDMAFQEISVYAGVLAGIAISRLIFESLS